MRQIPNVKVLHRNSSLSKSSKLVNVAVGGINVGGVKLDTILHKLLRSLYESCPFCRHLADSGFTLSLRSKKLVLRHMSQLAVVEINLLMERFQIVFVLHFDGLLHRTPWHEVWKVNRLRGTLKAGKGSWRSLFS